MKYLIFHTAADDSYMNTVENFRGADAGAEFVDMYFASATYAGTGAGFDKVRLTVTNGEEDRAIEQLANAMTRNSSVIIIADDVNSVYSCQDVTAVGAITLASQVQTRVVEDITAAKSLAASDSGKIFGLSLAAGFTVTLPAIADAGAGWHADFYVKTVTTSNAYIITEKAASDTNKIISQFLEAEVDTSDDGPHNAGHTTITFQGTPTLGDKVSIFCDGTSYFASGVTQDDAGVVLA